MKATFLGKHIPTTRRASYVPGDHLQETTRRATDMSGRTWPKGTKCRALAGGYSNFMKDNYAEMTMLGEPE